MDGDWARPAPPKRALGQVFLNSGAVIARIIKALDLAPKEPVLEIGPGRGALTQRLTHHDGPLTLVEKDDELARALIKQYGVHGVRVLNLDATELVLAPLVPTQQRFKVVANLPYNAGTPILLNLLRQRAHITRLVLMFQREVANRLTARPGDRNCGALSLQVQAQATVEALFDVSPERFVPRPKVWSSVVRITPRALDATQAAIVDDPRFETLLRALHAQPRKTVSNSLANGLRQGRLDIEAILSAAGIDVQARPCTVTPEQAIRLWQVMESR